MKNIRQKLKIKKKDLIIALLILIAFFYIGRPAILRSYISMYPTFNESDILYVDKITYRFKSPERGDVVVAIAGTDEQRDMPKDRFFRLIHPFYWDKSSKRLSISSLKPTNVKRVIGLPGDTIEIIDKQVFINGEVYIHGAEIYMEEKNYPSEYDFEMRVNMPAVTIPDKCYFLLGDHRDLSRDSRTFGYVHEKDIRGKIALLLYSHRDGKRRWFKRVDS